MCSQCQLKDEFQAHPAAQMIDVYSFFADRFYGVKDPRPIMPRERETPRVVREPEEAAPELSPEAPKEPTMPEPQSPSEKVQETSLEEEEKTTEIMESEEHTIVATPAEGSQEEPVEVPTEASPEVPTMEGEATEEEEAEPFADIIQNKDKKRYSPNPLPGQSSEQDTSSSN